MMATTVAQAVPAAARLVEEGLVLHRAGHLDAAHAVYERALALVPHHADALHLSGVVAMQQGRFADAFDLIGRAIEISPQASFFDNLGCTLLGWGKLVAAAECHRQAIALDASSFRAYNNLGNVLQRMRLPAAAAASFRTALTLNPSFVEAHCNLGNVLRELGEAALAADHCRQAIALNPAFGEAHNMLGNALKTLGKLDEAAQCYRAAARLMPHEAQVPLNLGIVCRERGLHEEAVASFRHALTLRPMWHEAWSNLLFTLSFALGVSAEAYLDEARRYGELMRAQVSPYTDWRADTAGDAPLRIGFVSADLRTHPVGFFIENVLGHLDAQRVQLYAYVTRPYEDALSERIKPRFAAWRSIVDLDDQSAARMIRDDGIHVLVDLSGHTDCNRLPVFAWKPAPVQTSWIAYFASTGLSAIDYVLGDRWVLPPEEADHFVESPWRLPHGYLCFTPPDVTAEADAALRAAREADASATGGAIRRTPTFGYFGDLVKLNDPVLEIWARILRAVPEANLFLKAQQLGDEAQRERLCARFDALGIERARLIMEGASPRAHYLAAYGRVDITLSPFPYPGGTTTAESLWMGVPVLCRRADRFLGHLCESVLQSIELGDWIAADDEDYVAKAVAFMRERASLNALAMGLRERMLGSSLCDAKRFAGSLESAFAGMWQAHLQAR